MLGWRSIAAIGNYYRSIILSIRVRFLVLFQTPDTPNFWMGFIFSFSRHPAEYFVKRQLRSSTLTWPDGSTSPTSLRETDMIIITWGVFFSLSLPDAGLSMS